MLVADANIQARVAAIRKRSKAEGDRGEGVRHIRWGGEKQRLGQWVKRLKLMRRPM
ncbi:unnamed protein product [Ectocarpus sp. CCAP 1310/34]|nr:unnamed protein product [Ectocarpus sp. CCAP 1310/34]